MRPPDGVVLAIVAIEMLGRVIDIPRTHDPQRAGAKEEEPVRDFGDWLGSRKPPMGFARSKSNAVRFPRFFVG